MSERKPLTTLQNGCSARRTVRRTYGKKGKASSAGSKNFFITMDEIQTKMSRFDISEIREDAEKENQDLPQPTHDNEPTKTNPQISAQPERPATAVKRSLDMSRPSSSETDDKISPDERAVLEFAKKFSGHGVLAFTTYGNTVGDKYIVRKIGEGSYSSVFALSCKYATGLGADENTGPLQRTTIIKLMPIALPSQGRRSGMTEPDLIANELQTMKVMDPIHGFIRYRGLTVVKGKWPSNFTDAFHAYRKSNKLNAINEDPETAYDSSQFFALIEMADAGKETNLILRPSDFQIYDIFWSTCIHLANAECHVQFEHRDLHVSNICVKPADAKEFRIDVEKSTVEEMQEVPNKVLGMSNIAISIIDYTYSRVTPPVDIDADQTTTFRDAVLESEQYEDLAHSFSRLKSGTKTDDFEIQLQDLTYAKVTKCVNLFYDRAYNPESASHGQVWETFVPRTNVCWLGYLITSLLKRAGKISRTKYVAGSNDIAKWVQDDIRKRMLELKECLMNVDVDNIPKSANDVVEIGVKKGWLKKEEIEAFRARLEEDS